MKIDKVNLFLLHSQLIKDDYQLPVLNELRDSITTSLSCYYDSVIPAFERLKSEGKIDSWGIGLGEEEALISAINYEKQPEAMQCAVNVMNSIGAIGYISKKPNPNRILEECQDKDIPILAIRAVQAGALTSKMDREPHPSGRDKPDFIDYEKAKPFRVLAKEWGESPASLAHRYTLSIQKVSSVILGVKNTKELQECIEAESKDNLNEAQLKELEGSIDHKIVKIDEEILFFKQTQQQEKSLKEERLNNLVDFYKKMTPKKAAPIMENLDKDLLVQLFQKFPKKYIYRRKPRTKLSTDR